MGLDSSQPDDLGIESLYLECSRWCFVIRFLAKKIGSRKPCERYRQSRPVNHDLNSSSLLLAVRRQRRLESGLLLANPYQTLFSQLQLVYDSRDPSFLLEGKTLMACSIKAKRQARRGYLVITSLVFTFQNVVGFCCEDARRDQILHEVDP